MRLKLVAATVCLGGIVSLLGYVAYHQFYIRGLQGEAKLMLSYLHTLQRVHRLEHGSYVAFDNYGAAIHGEDQCRQPEDAARLGFLIPGCHKKGVAPPRYSYRSKVDAKGESYTLEAQSGSDRLNRSFVCFEAAATELWRSTQNLEFNLVISCW